MNEKLNESEVLEVAILYVKKGREAEFEEAFSKAQDIISTHRCSGF